MQSADTVLGVLRERDRRHGVITGEPDARKRASPVRREAARKRTRPAGPSPCGPPSSAHSPAKHIHSWLRSRQRRTLRAFGVGPDPLRLPQAVARPERLLAPVASWPGNPRAFFLRPPVRAAWPFAGGARTATVDEGDRHRLPLLRCRR